MAIVNLKTILPNDSQIVITDKINYNFDQILTAGGGPPGDPGLIGDQGIPGGQGIIGPDGDDGDDGNKWYVGFGIPPTQPSPELYLEGDLFLSTSDNYIWEFDGTFWQNTGLQLKVAAGEFKSNSASPTNTAVILQSASKNLVVSSVDYDGNLMNPTSPFYNSKFKIVSPPGVFMEMGLDLGVSPWENQANHVTFELDGTNNLNINNNAGGFLLTGNGDANIVTSGSVALNSVFGINQTDGQYTGTIINGTDLVNKAYVDGKVSAITITGLTYDVVRIGSSLSPEASSFMKIKPTAIVINEANTQTITATRLDVHGGVKMEAMSGGDWDQTNSRFQKKGGQLECWGSFQVSATSSADITFTTTFPHAYGSSGSGPFSLQSIPYVNITYFPVTNVNEVWTMKQLSVTTTGFTFKLFYAKRALTTGFTDVSFTTPYFIRVYWHAVGGLFPPSQNPVDQQVDQGALGGTTPVTPGGTTGPAAGPGGATFVGGPGGG